MAPLPGSADAAPVRSPFRPSALTDGPFTTSTATAAGVTRNALRGPAWRQLFRGVWIAAQLPVDRSTWLAAARLVLPVDAVLCLWSALDLLGFDLRAPDDVVVHAAFDHKPPRTRSGMQLRQLALHPTDALRRGGWLVTSPLRTAFDCARLLPFVEAVVVVDALAHAQVIGLEDLAAYAGDRPAVRSVRQVGKVLAAADRRSESPMETRLRLLLVAAGVHGLVPQWTVRTATGRFVARLDLAIPELKIAIEYDGAWHWKQRRSDDRRRDAVRGLDWTVLVFSAEDYYRHPDQLVRDVVAAIARASSRSA